MSSSGEHDRAVERLAELKMQARYHRDRHRLYAARVGGSRPTSLSKLAELRRARELAEESFRRAEADDRKRSPSRASVGTP